MLTAETNALTLTVKTGDLATEVFILDGQFQKIVSGIGETFTCSLPPGLYTVKVRAGSEYQEKLLSLVKDETIAFEPLQINSSAPLENSYNTSEFQISNAENHSKKKIPDISLSKGSRVFIFIDNSKNLSESNPGASGNNPGAGLSLRNYDDEVLLDFENAREAQYSENKDSWSCAVEISPGSYCLCLKTANGDQLKQTIVAASGWQTQVFLTLREYGLNTPEVKADLAGSSIFMARIGEGFNSGKPGENADNTGFRITELIRQALMNRRYVLSTDLLSVLFSGKFENPMFGIYAAHLLLLNPDFVFSELKTVVTNLRNLLGKSHPDVEAIALKAGMSEGFVFKTFPMLSKSWDLVIEASVQNPGVVEMESVAAKYSGQFWNCDLWLIWGRETELNRKGVYEQIRNYTTQDNLLNKANLKTEPEFLEMVSGEEIKNEKAEDSITKNIQTDNLLIDKEKISDEQYLTIVQTLGIPRSSVESVIDDSSLSKQEVEPEVNRAVEDEPGESAITINKDDPQKGIWGKKPKRNSREMTAKVKKSVFPNFYTVTITVKSTNDKLPLKGNVIFHLHDTFLNQDPEVAVKNGKAVLKLSAVWGAFTVGAEADGGKTRLELDLAELEDAPKKFREL
jgi:hypothetical protein